MVDLFVVWAIKAWYFVLLFVFAFCHSRYMTKTLKDEKGCYFKTETPLKVAVLVVAVLVCVYGGGGG